MILAGGVLTFYAVGSLLIGSLFVLDLPRLIPNPQTFFTGYSGAELMAPFVLLLVSAVLGALGTRAIPRTLFVGLRNGDAPTSIAKALTLHLLVALALFSGSRGRQ